ncbi:Actin cross-linking [Parasponia andersonii]|uniref:Actin cross-linking n=1 Tax=Parasponia andersonii TaxID=3476 RepID=A0A2P5CEP2_PARAD|nr:Actin cross-linking [Parasponia andersonii]
MEFFNKAKSVRLKSHLDKYLFADEDDETVRQTRNGSSRRAWWTVELVQGKSHVIRLRSFHGKYLIASDEPFLLGMTGKKVLLRETNNATSAKSNDTAFEWEPRTEGFQIKLRSVKGGKYLRANGGMPPWRNTVTHDVPNRTATQNWILWNVDVVDINVVEHMITEDDDDFVSCRLSPTSSLSSFSEWSDNGSPSSIRSVSMGSAFGVDRESSMELFHKARVVRLRSHHDKYLLADDDEETVVQDRNGSVRNARWSVELVQHANVLRFKSCYGKYLTASNMPFLLGMTGKKVLQTLPNRLDSSIEWEPIREGFQVRLKTHYGQFLRANGGLPPWRNSITHDIPHRTSTQDWILWDVDVIEIRVPSPKRPRPPPVTAPTSDSSSEPCSPAKIELTSPKFSEGDQSSDFDGSLVKAEGRVIYYRVSNGEEDVDDAREELSFTFKGSGVEELKQKLKEETGLHDVVVCSRNPLNGKLYPLRLHLPPNNTDMRVVVVRSTSSEAEE